MSVEQSSVHSVRKRARKACESCRKRKRRCDGNQPCRACVEYEYDCHYVNQNLASMATSEQHDPITAATLSVRSSHSPKTTGRTGSAPENRCLASSGVMGFPQWIAQTLCDRRISVPPSFGYNVGRPNSDPDRNYILKSLTNVMSLEIAEQFCQRYHTSCNTLFPVLDGHLLRDELHAMFAGQSLREPISTISLTVTFAVLLGSYLSWPLLAEKHDALSLHAQQELDHLTFRQHSLDDYWLLRAWILRTLLLRLTSQPDLAWLSSCNMMHVAELLQDASQQDVGLSEEATTTVSQADIRTFNTAWSLNRLIALEGGRSGTSLSAAPLKDDNPTHVMGFLQLKSDLVQIQSCDAETSGAAMKNCLLDLCHSRVGGSSSIDACVLLMRACIMCTICRQILRQGTCLDINLMLALKAFFRSALLAAEKVLDLEEPWFMLVEFSTLLLCVCLTVERPFMELVPPTLSLFYQVNQNFHSQTLKDTEQTVSSLIQIYLESRDEASSALRKSLQMLPVSNSLLSPGLRMEEEWTHFLNQQILG